MSSKSAPRTDCTGPEFVRFVKSELERKNRGLGRTSLAEVSRAAGYSAWWLGRLVEAERPNPTVLAMRSVFFVLGYEIANPEEDVIPHLKSKGVYHPNAESGDAS